MAYWFFMYQANKTLVLIMFLVLVQAKYFPNEYPSPFSTKSYSPPDNQLKNINSFNDNIIQNLQSARQQSNLYRQIKYDRTYGNQNNYMNFADSLKNTKKQINNLSNQMKTTNTSIKKQKNGQIKVLFNSFIKKYPNDRQANSQQKVYMLKNFQNNYERIRNHNNNPNVKYKLGMTPMMDLQQKTFIRGVLMQLPQKYPQMRPRLTVPQNFTLKQIDWRKHMTEVKHQQTKCGSCYAFSITSLLQAYYSIKYNETKKFSQQQIVDCCVQGCNGCKGGWPGSALDYISQKGAALNQKYPYKAKKQDCRIKNSEDLQKIIDYQNPYNEVYGVKGLAFALLQGPVNIILDASTWDPLYKGGVFNACPNGNIYYNHAVICTGVKKDGVWIIRNSWGAGWGDKGHIYLAQGNSCGIADRALVPVFLQSQDEQQEEQSQQNTQQSEQQPQQQEQVKDQEQEQGEQDQGDSEETEESEDIEDSEDSEDSQGSADGQDEQWKEDDDGLGAAPPDQYEQQEQDQ